MRVPYIGKTKNGTITRQEAINLMCQFRAAAKGEDENFFYYQAILHSLNEGLPVQAEDAGSQIVVGLSEQAINYVDGCGGVIFDPYINYQLVDGDWVDAGVFRQPKSHVFHISSAEVERVCSVYEGGDISDAAERLGGYIDAKAADYCTKNNIKAYPMLDICILDCELKEYPAVMSFESDVQLLESYADAVKRFGMDAYIEVSF